MSDDPAATVLCSHCFKNEGLRLNAEKFEPTSTDLSGSVRCPNCGSSDGKKLSRQQAEITAHSFFVWGSLKRATYGAAPRIQMNTQQEGDIRASADLEGDMALIRKVLNLRLFHYGPRLWMLGHITPLQEMQDKNGRSAVIDRILRQYPERLFPAGRKFYRLRKNPSSEELPDEYDAPPVSFSGGGRLDPPGFPVMYASEDLQVCFHECRVSAEDDIFVATLVPVSELRLLDLTVLLPEEERTTEFESLDLAVHMLFLAGKHSYEITREITLAAHAAGFDGLIYPSYFSMLKAGTMPFETTYGISHRRIKQYADYEQSKITPNMAIFGRPIESGLVEVQCINRSFLTSVQYNFGFGPVGFS
jgi:hypothetical protein